MLLTNHKYCFKITTKITFDIVLFQDTYFLVNSLKTRTFALLFTSTDLRKE